MTRLTAQRCPVCSVSVTTSDFYDYMRPEGKAQNLTFEIHFLSFYSCHLLSLQKHVLPVLQKLQKLTLAFIYKRKRLNSVVCKRKAQNIVIFQFNHWPRNFCAYISISVCFALWFEASAHSSSAECFAWIWLVARGRFSSSTKEKKHLIRHCSKVKHTHSIICI